MPAAETPELLPGESRPAHIYHMGPGPKPCRREITQWCSWFNLTIPFVTPQGMRELQTRVVLQPLRCPHCGDSLVYEQKTSPIVVPGRLS